MVQHFDVAIIGMQMSGLVAAALLAKRGFRVVLVDHGESPGTYAHLGLQLPLQPQLVPACQYSPPMQRVHEALGLGPIFRTSSTPVEPAFQALLPGHRLSIFTQPQALAHELGLEFPDMVKPVQNFLARIFSLDDAISDVFRQVPALPPRFAWQRLLHRKALSHVTALHAPWTPHAFLTDIPAGHPLRMLLLSPLQFFGYRQETSTSILEAVRVLARFYRGTLTLESPIPSLQHLMLHTAQQAGVTIYRGVHVQALHVSRGRLTELHLKNDRCRHTAAYFIANTLQPLQQLLVPKPTQPDFFKETQKVSIGGGLLVFNMVVLSSAIPRGMASNVLLLGEQPGPSNGLALAPEAPLVWLQRLAPHALSGRDDPSHVVLHGASAVYLQDIQHRSGYLAELKNRMLERIRCAIPFLDGFIQGVSWPMQHPPHPPTDPHAFPWWGLRPIFTSTPPSVWGIAARSIQTSYKNLLHSSCGVLPGLGLEGEYMTGLGLTETLQKWKGILRPSRSSMASDV